MAVLTIITLSIAVMTPPLSGPFCKGSCFKYPYADITARFPRDYVWMYPAMLLTLLFLVVIACIHRQAPEEKKIFSLLGVLFSAMSASVLVADYFLQVSVIQQSLLQAEKDGLALLTQYNPHGIFIALEDLGYLLMSLAFICLVPVFSVSCKTEKTLRWLFIGNFSLSLISLALISAIYGINREYRFEVAVISFNWLTLIVFGILMSGIFRRNMQKSV